MLVQTPSKFASLKLVFQYICTKVKQNKMHQLFSAILFVEIWKNHRSNPGFFQVGSLLLSDPDPDFFLGVSGSGFFLEGPIRIRSISSQILNPAPPPTRKPWGDQNFANATRLCWTGMKDGKYINGKRNIEMRRKKYCVKTILRE